MNGASARTAPEAWGRVVEKQTRVAIKGSGHVANGAADFVRKVVMGDAPEEERTFFVDVASRRSNGEEISVEEERHWRLLNWRSDFADPEEAPTFDEEFPFPINTDVNRELGDEMTARDAAGTLLDGVDSLDLPALFLHGQRDPRPAAIDIAQALPSGRLVMIDGAGHLPWFERPEAVKEEFRRLVQHRV